MGAAPNYTSDNVVEANDIHHVMRDLVDSAGIYSLGIETGTVYRANYVHDIRRVTGVSGGPVAGIYFDEGSRDIHVERNVVRDVPMVLHFNQCTHAEQTWTDNYFEGPKEPKPAVAGSAGEEESVIRNAGPEKAYQVQ